jgi:hypothetical protein
MTEQDKKQLWMEIEHIFDSGANEMRVFNMVKDFIEKRHQALNIAPVMPSCEGNCGMNYCDDNGCIERKRILVEPKDLPEHEV